MATELSVTAGRLLQAATRAMIVRSATGRRVNWSYYLARPAVVEAIGRLTPPDVVEGFLRDESRNGFDLAAVCTQWMDWAQSSADLDHRNPFPAPRLRLRWTAVAGSPARIVFRVHNDRLRQVRIVASEEVMDSLPGLCQDLALHDWLLSSLISLIDTASIGQRNREQVLTRLRPAVDHLMQAWMPATRSRDEVAPFWAALERSSGLTRQWENAVSQVRDQVALAAALRTLSGSLSLGEQPMGGGRDDTGRR